MATALGTVVKYGRGIITTIPGVGILSAWGKGAPVDSEAGYATGCSYKRIDGSSDTALYTNEGSVTSSSWIAQTT